MNSDGFILVGKRKRAKAKTLKPDVKKLVTVQDSAEDCIVKILKAKEELLGSRGYVDLRSKLEEISLHLLNETKHKISTVVCYGLGQPSESRIACFQTALLLILKDYFSADVEIYDPVFTDTDVSVLKKFDFSVLEKNEEGKRIVVEPTLFYMPHCGKGLYNNLLWSNWNCDCLLNCVIIGNSFLEIVDNIPERVMKKYYRYILQAAEYFSEYPITNLVQENDIFNDMSIHLVHNKNHVTHTDDFWTVESELQYEHDVGFVQVEM